MWRRRSQSSKETVPDSVKYPSVGIADRELGACVRYQHIYIVNDREKWPKSFSSTFQEKQIMDFRLSSMSPTKYYHAGGELGMFSLSSKRQTEMINGTSIS